MTHPLSNKLEIAVYQNIFNTLCEQNTPPKTTCVLNSSKHNDHILTSDKSEGMHDIYWILNIGY